MQSLNLSDHIPASLTKQQRQQLLKRLIKTVRHRNQERMRQQIGPNGERWPARKANSNLKMMRELRKNKHFKLRARAAIAAAGFVGHTARIASNHHHGKAEKVGPRVIHYPARQLIGVNDADTTALQHETKQFIDEIN